MDNSSTITPIVKGTTTNTKKLRAIVRFVQVLKTRSLLLIIFAQSFYVLEEKSFNSENILYTNFILYFELKTI